MKCWPKKPLGEFVEEQTKRLRQEITTIYSVTNERGFVRSLDLFDKQVFSADTGNYKRVGFHDLAYNPSRINVGSVAMLEDKNGGAVSPMYVIVRCKTGLLPSYLLHFLKSDAGLHQIKQRCEGAVRFQLKFRDLCAIPILVPPLAEQERILKIVDNADELRNLRAQADNRTAALLPALFNEMFGDPIENPKGWPLSTFTNHLELLEYGPRFFNEAYSNSGTRIIRITDLDAFGNLNFSTMPKLEVDSATLKTRSLQPGELIFARTGATVGKVAVIPEDAPVCIAGAYFLRLRFGLHIHPLYAAHLIRCPSIQTIITNGSKQSAQPNFSGPGIRSLPLPIPPLPLQKQFAQRVAEIRELEATQAASRQRLESLFQSMLHRAFNGDV